MSQLLPEDLHYIVTRLPRDLVKLMKTKQIFMGGGCIRDLVAKDEVSDYDLFGHDKLYLEEVAAQFATAREGRTWKTDNAVTVIAHPRKPVQFITRWLFSDAETLAQSFDFSIAQAVVWYAEGGWHSYVSDNFYADLAARRLRYLSPVRNEDAGGSMLRVCKFLRRGYNIAPESLGKVMARLYRGVREEDFGLWNEGEAGKAKVLTGLLREVDPLTVVDGLEVAEVHEVEKEDA